MSTEGVYDFKKDVRKYIAVFIALACLTLITVAASYMETGNHVGILIAIVIATIKASLVACYFMHLISERKLIYAVLILTAVFFLGLMLLPVSGFHGAQTGIEHLS